MGGGSFWRPLPSDDRCCTALHCTATPATAVLGWAGLAAASGDERVLRPRIARRRATTVARAAHPPHGPSRRGRGVTCHLPRIRAA